MQFWPRWGAWVSKSLLEHRSAAKRLKVKLQDMMSCPSPLEVNQNFLVLGDPGMHEILVTNSDLNSLNFKGSLWPTGSCPMSGACSTHALSCKCLLQIFFWARNVCTPRGGEQHVLQTSATIYSQSQIDFSMNLQSWWLAANGNGQSVCSLELDLSRAIVS